MSGNRLTLVYLAVVAVIALALPQPAAAQSAPMPPLDVGTDHAAPGFSRLDPNRQLGRIAWLPALSADATTGDCHATVSILSTSAEPAKAVILWFGAAGACTPKCAGPMAVTCTGLIRPGGTWHAAPEYSVGTIGSAAVVLFVDRRMSDVYPGLDPAGVSAMSVADYLCGYLRSTMVGKCDPYRRFVKAVTEGLDYSDAGVSMFSATSRDQPVVTVTRNCAESGGSSGLATYTAPNLADLGAYDPVARGYRYSVGLPTSLAGKRLAIHVQSASIQCTSLDLWFRGNDGCQAARWCASVVLASGDSRAVDVTECVAAGGPGQVQILSGSPVAVVAESRGPGTADTWRASAEVNYFPYQTAESIDPGLAWLDRHTLFAPVAAGGWLGWETVVHVVNQSTAAPAKVRLALLADTGAVIRTLTDWLCPGGGRSFDLSVMSGVPEGWLGSIRVDSLTLPVPGSWAAPEIAGTITLSRPGTGAATVELTPSDRVFPWWVGIPSFPDPGDSVAWHGTGALAVPVQPGDQQAVAVQNVTPGAGYADLATYVFDQNGLTGVLCHRLDAGHTLRLNPAALAPAGPAFHGNLLVSATAWHHVLPGAITAPGPAFIGLTASTLAWSAAVGPDRATAATGVARDNADSPWSFTGVSSLGWLPPSCSPDDR